jgi:hypothetical protein
LQPHIHNDEAHPTHERSYRNKGNAAHQNL